MKQKSTTTKFILVIIFCLVLGFGFGKGEKAEAAVVDKGYCYCFKENDSTPYTSPNSDNTYTKNSCDTACQGLGYHDGMVTDKSPEKVNFVGGISKGKKASGPDSCSGAGEWKDNFINCLLLTILNLMVSLLQLSTALFEWIMAPENITSVIGNDVIYSAWGTVRDVLNVSFIMFLLFSAFATVFQIDKYSYKNILKTLVIMALLVNFSFPISRFIIDVSNMMMYYFASALGMDAGKTVIGFADATGLPEIIYSGGIGNASTTALFTAVIFIFIFAVTVLTITVLFVIRTIALAILIIFSSLAFVGTAIPPLASYASDWWSKLFKYAFFGPIMLFMIYIASTLMTALAKSGMSSMKDIATDQSGDPDTIAALSFFVIPIVILWMGLGIAQSMSIAGAGAVVGKAQGFMKGAGKWTVRAPFKYTGATGTYKKFSDDFKKTGKLFGKKIPLMGTNPREEREERLAGFMSGGRKGYKDASQNIKNKKIAEAVDKNKKEDKSKIQLENELTSTNEATKMAAALTLAEKGLISDIALLEKTLKAAGSGPKGDEIRARITDKIPKDKLSDLVKTGNDLKRVTDLVGGSGSTQSDSLRKRLKEENNAKALIEYDHTYGGKTKAEAYKENLKGLSAEKIAKQRGGLLSDNDFHTEYFSTIGDPAFIQETAKKMNLDDRADWRRRRII
ncbi:MAG: hypothetical protein WC678_02280 [Parcubacteria group bacterium]|jgi:hypothetical protein